MFCFCFWRFLEVAWEKAKMLSKQSERGRDTPSTPEGFQVQKQKRPHSERASEPAVWVRAGRKRLSGLDPPRLLPPGPKASGFRPAGLGSYQRSLQTWGLQTRRTALQSGRLGADGGGGHSRNSGCFHSSSPILPHLVPLLSSSQTLGHRVSRHPGQEELGLPIPSYWRA